jgi:hypothetical protein
MKKIIIIISISFLISGVLFAEGATEAKEFGNINSDRRVLIATENSNFKDSLVTEIVSLLNDGNIYIKVLLHKYEDLNNEDPRNYGAVLLINAGQKSIVRPWVTEYLNNVSEYNDNIILLTTIVLDWEPDVEVDSITTASDMGVVSDLASELAVKINALLN